MAEFHTRMRLLKISYLNALAACLILSIAINLSNASLNTYNSNDSLDDEDSLDGNYGDVFDNQPRYGKPHRNSFERSISRSIFSDLYDCLSTLRKIKNKRDVRVRLPESCCRLLKLFPSKTIKEQVRLYCPAKRENFFNRYSVL